MSEPSEAMVEAAAKAIADCHNPGMFERYPENWRVEARAALKAAQGAAPQASKKSCGPCRRGQHGCCDGNEYLRCECSHGATPVLPSSGVEEDKLAEVVCLALNHRDGGDECEDDYRVARAVTEWLEGQGVGKY